MRGYIKLINTFRRLLIKIIKALYWTNVPNPGWSLWTGTPNQGVSSVFFYPHNIPTNISPKERNTPAPTVLYFFTSSSMTMQSCVSSLASYDQGHYHNFPLMKWVGFQTANNPALPPTSGGVAPDYIISLRLKSMWFCRLYVAVLYVKRKHQA